MAADPSRRRPEYHPAVNDVLLTLTNARGTLADVQRRLDLEFRAAYPDHANPAKLVARVKRLEEEAAALKEMCRDLLTQKQELIDQIRVSLMAQRGMTQRLLAASGLPPLSDADETVHNSLNEVIQDWTAQVSPITREIEDLDKKKNANQMLFSAII
ncbi:uncharacterized protein LOC100276200 [Zea mays]|uniref:Protein FAM33A n=1 Tax=Zea mays TaxID=4577 RepID=B6T6K6_MAIZE|nr:uncharacterized protein LOC100276200 [Zea mays]ACG32739.1 hypothetical protein [Zea mays]AQK55881.1 hypothetical protein ZEAMMB73_Zm00001d052049 [Zea mays]|eukprot:NP_001143517.1 uncharacterized protein LOC100276200 [Zea mays]